MTDAQWPMVKAGGARKINPQSSVIGNWPSAIRDRGAHMKTLREIYLPPFEASVKVGHAATVMGAYNAIRVLDQNGALIEDNFCCENRFLLRKVLKREWGFKGILVSDYNAIHNGVLAALNGCDVDLPAGLFMNPTTLGPVIGANLLKVSIIDDKVRRILRGVISYGYLDRQQLDPTIPQDNYYSEYVSLQIAREGVVLLKNRNNLLPLGSGVRRVAVIGDYLKSAPPTGFGSSYVPQSTSLANWMAFAPKFRPTHK
jgi:beta-glucosidase